MKTIEFGNRSSANDIRSRPAVRRHLSPADDRRTKSVKLESNTPKQVLSRVSAAAAESRRAKASKAGQSPLSRRERRDIDFSKPGVNVPKVRSIKAIAEQEGVEDFESFADLTLTVDENRELLKAASQEERGRRGRGRSREDERTMQAARGRQAQRRGAKSAIEPALLEQDPEAQSFLQEERDFGTDVFDISFQSDGPTVDVSGRTAETLRERNQQRSKKARNMDRRLAAPKTRDPIAWANAPSQLDFPGIDTVDPEFIHSSRSTKAQKLDEQLAAPLAESPEEWAADPSETDLPGVDTPTGPDLDNLGGLE